MKCRVCGKKTKFMQRFELEQYACHSCKACMDKAEKLRKKLDIFIEKAAIMNIRTDQDMFMELCFEKYGAKFMREMK